MKTTTPLEDRRMFQYFTRISANEDERIRAAAALVGKPPATWGREVILAAVDRVLARKAAK